MEDNRARLASAIRKVGIDTLQRPVKAIMSALENKDIRTKAISFAITANAKVLNEGQATSFCNAVYDSILAKNATIGKSFAFDDL